MTYDCKIKQPMPMCECELMHLLYRKPQLINGLDRSISYPFFQDFAHIPSGENYIIWYNSFMLYKQYILIYHLCFDNIARKCIDDHIV